MYSSTWPSPGRTWPAVPRRTVSTPAVCTLRACPRVDTPRYVCALMSRAGVSFFAHLVGSSAHAHVARLTTRTYSSTRPHQQMWRTRNPEVLLAPDRTLPCSTFALPHDWSCVRSLYVAHLDAAPVIDGRTCTPAGGRTHPRACARVTLDLYLSASLLAIPCRTYLPTFAPSSSPLV